MKSALDLAKEHAGNTAALARAISALGKGKITSQAISQWSQVPASRVLDVEKVTGVPRHKLRPDLYPPENGVAA